MKLVVVVVVVLLAVVGYANRPPPKPMVVATATQARTVLRGVAPTATRDPAERRPLILVSDCMKAPSQCSLQNGVPDWTTPAYGCDWNYATKSTGCVPDQPGDYDCPDLHAMGLWEIRVVGDDWMLLDEDGDGVGCEIDSEAVAAEAARCDSLYEPERTRCFGVLQEYSDALQYELENRDYDNQHGDDYYDPYEEDLDDMYRGGPLD